MNIQFRGREVEVEEVCDGVVKKNDKTYYIKDSVTGEWLYCCAARYESLEKKFGSAKDLGEKYVGRKGKQDQPKAEVAEEPAEEVAEATPTEQAAVGLSA